MQIIPDDCPVNIAGTARRAQYDGYRRGVSVI